MKHLSNFPTEVGMTSGHKLKLFFSLSILGGKINHVNWNCESNITFL